MIPWRITISGGTGRTGRSKNRCRGYLCSLILIYLLIPAPVLSEKITIDSDEQFEFALQYMQRNQYQRAIGEFERFIYFFPKNERVPEALYHMGECYLEERAWDPARKSLERVYRDFPQRKIAGKALFLIGESYYRQGRMEEAERHYQAVIEAYPDSELKNAALYRIGWSRMNAGDWRQASEGFQRVGRDSPLYLLSHDLSKKGLEGEELPYKDPTTAGIMAGILPGLGHAYCERYKDGLIAFLLNGLFVWATYESFEEDHEVLGGILGFLELGWYSGNIYSAVNSAHKYNRKLRVDFLRSLPDQLDLDLVKTRERPLGLALKFDF